VGPVSLRRLIAESFLPRGAFGRAVLAVALLRAPVIWLVSSIVRREPVEVTALYRPSGDVQYLEIVAALSRGELGESNLLELAGQGLHPFPLASVVVHAALLAAFGAPGLLVGDVLASFALAGTLGVLGRLLGLSAARATAFVGFVTSSMYVVLWPITTRLGWGKDLLWGDRFPRPYVSETFLLAAAIVAVVLWTRPHEPRRRAFWIVTGLACSLLVQSDIYGVFVLGAAAAAAWLRAARIAPARRGELLRGAAIAGAAIAATAWPFALQRRHATPEILERWGAYRVDRVEAIGWIREVSPLPPLALGAAIAVALLLSRTGRARGSEPPLGSIASFWAFVTGIAALAMPAFSALLGQGIYPYHFGDRLRRLATYGICFVLLAAVRWPARLEGRPRRWLAVGFAFAMLALVGARAWENAGRTGHTRRSQYDFSALGSYRDPFAELVRRLDAPDLRGAVVLATVDQQVHVHWQVFGGGRSFLPDGWVSLAPDAEVERRFARFGRLIGMSSDEWLDLTEDDGIHMCFLGVAKYAANRAHTFAPLGAYTPEQQAAIARRSLYDSFAVEIPPSERERLRRLYEETPAKSAEALPDLLVLTNDARFRRHAPAEEAFEAVFENRVFRLYRRRNPKEPGRGQ
jgi:hypothetical protein